MKILTIPTKWTEQATINFISDLFKNKEQLPDVLPISKVMPCMDKLQDLYDTKYSNNLEILRVIVKANNLLGDYYTWNNLAEAKNSSELTYAAISLQHIYQKNKEWIDFYNALSTTFDKAYK